MKFAHLSDAHIRLQKFHKTYQVVFDELYGKLKKIDGLDYIVFTGDLFHSKNTLSPEAVDMASKFLSNLADIAPLYIILGNHDLLLRNLSRQDSVSPLISALDNLHIHFLKFSQEAELHDNFNFCHLSLCDKENWKVPSDPNKINILLYHGAVKGAITDTGWVVEDSELNLEMLHQFDYGFLGDIHRANQSVEDSGRHRWSGSLLQNNFGEDEEKGFLLWDIQNKEDFTCEFVQLDNPNPFVTIILDEGGKLPANLSIKPGSRIRLISGFGLSYETTKTVIDGVKNRFSVESVTYVCNVSPREMLLESSVDGAEENLRDTKVQEELIRENFAGQEIEDEFVDKAVELNNKYNIQIGHEEEIARNVRWRLKSLEWDNLFNYGEGNRIDFANLKGVVGIFGKSAFGKSSSIDSILYTIYNTTSKRSRKNYHIINQNKNRCEGRAVLEIDGMGEYEIIRSSEKYEKKLHGVITSEAKTTVDFRMLSEDGDNLNGVERTDTDNAIRNRFGSIDDFLITTMASQFGSMSFIDEGSTRRKEILARFLDLDIFDKKFKMAKEDAADIKAALKKFDGGEHEKLINSIKK
ncbi:MAG: metallophosphoesterase, partial [Magnetococcus sp. WYHC-3]